jgi:hypothetical protein
MNFDNHTLCFASSLMFLCLLWALTIILFIVKAHNRQRNIKDGATQRVWLVCYELWQSYSLCSPIFKVPLSVMSFDNHTLCVAPSLKDGATQRVWSSKLITDKGTLKMGQHKEYDRQSWQSYSLFCLIFNVPLSVMGFDDHTLCVAPSLMFLCLLSALTIILFCVAPTQTKEH